MKPVALGMHIYAGGFTLGVQAAGFKTLAHLEEWNFGVKTSRDNLMIEVRTPVSNWRPEEFAGKVDLLYCNPPCAIFSVAGVSPIKERNVEKWKHDGRTNCTNLCFEMIGVIRPKMFIWECVAAAFTKGREFIEIKVKEVAKLGYRSHVVLFNGRDCGLPQSRKRMFFVASTLEFDPVLPKRSTYLTPKDVWSNLPKGHELDCPEMNKRDIAPLKWCHKNQSRSIRGGWEAQNEVVMVNGKAKGRPPFVCQSVLLDKPAGTITGGDVYYHPTELRKLSVIEQQLLCGYPVDYEFKGRLGEKYQQIGKAVTPPAGEWIARQCKKAIENDEQTFETDMVVHDFIKANK